MNKTMLKKHVGLKEFRENMDTYIKRVGKGESLTVFRHNEPVFRMMPVGAEDDTEWETVIDFTEINPNGVPAKDVLKALRKMREATSKSA